MLRYDLWRSRSTKPTARAAAASRLGRYPNREAIRRLIELLKDPSEEVKEPAAVALGRTRDPEAFEPLAEALRNGVMTAVEPLGRWRDPRAIPVLVETLPKARSAAVTALEENYPGWRQSEGVQLAGPSLIMIWENGRLEEQLEAARWLATFKETRAVPALIRVVARDPHEAYKLRPAALRTLESIDPDWSRRDEALTIVPVLAAAWMFNSCSESRSALKKIGRVAPQALVQALCDDRWDVRHGAQAILGEILSLDAVAPLLAVVRKPNAAEFATQALLKLVKSAAAQIPTEALQELAKLDTQPGIHWELKSACNVGAVGSTGSEVQIDCGQLRSLALLELELRGKEGLR